jgi:hypothetical protein
VKEEPSVLELVCSYVCTHAPCNHLDEVILVFVYVGEVGIIRNSCEDLLLVVHRLREWVQLMKRSVVDQALEDELSQSGVR